MNDERSVPEVRSTPYSNPFYSYGSAIMMLTDPSSELYDLELNLRGVKVGERNQLVEVGEPLLNDFGVNCVLGLVKGAVNQVTIMSNLDKGNINSLSLIHI